MASYLLSSRAVFDVAKNQNLPAQRWIDTAPARSIPRSSILMSAVTPMRLLHQLDEDIAAARKGQGPRNLSVHDLQVLRRNVEKTISDYDTVPMDVEIAHRWGWLLDTRIEYLDENGAPYPIPSSEKIEIATALVGRGGVSFVFVDKHEPGHNHIAGLTVEDLSNY